METKNIYYTNFQELCWLFLEENKYQNFQNPWTWPRIFALYQPKITTYLRKFSTKAESASLVKELLATKPIGSTHTVQGWATSVRKMGKLIFVDVNDGSCFNHLQVLFPKENLKKPIQNGSSVNVKGTVQITDKGQLELHADEISVVGEFDVTDSYPFTLKKKQSYDHYREHLHFRPKIKYFHAMIRFRSAASLKFHEYFSKNNFIFIHTPVLTSGDCEGAAETFSVKPDSQELINTMRKDKVEDNLVFFNSPAYLTVSGQLHLEAVIRSFSKVYTFNTSFRAENSPSRLHLSEFYMIEAEEAFITDLQSVLFRIEHCFKDVMSYLLNNNLDEIKYMLEHNETNIDEHLAVLEKAVKEKFTVMSFTDAKNLINKNLDKLSKFKPTPFNLTKAEELFLVKQNNNMPVFIVDWPKNEKPFYMKECEENSDLVKAVDLLVPNVGEVCGGSVREDNYDILKQRLLEMNTLKSLQWYLDLRKYGSVPSGGFGIGFERFLQYMLNIQNIKDTIPFPRWPYHLQM